MAPVIGGFLMAMGEFQSAKYSETYLQKLIDKRNAKKAEDRENKKLAIAYRKLVPKMNKVLKKTPRQIARAVEKSRKAEIKKLKQQIKKGEKYRKMPFETVIVKMYRDLSPNQQVILALVRKGICSTGKLETMMTFTQENILRIIYILCGKGYLQSYKKLYFPIEFPKKDLRKAAIDYWHGCHPVNRDTHDMRLARMESLEEKELDKIRWNLE